MAIIVPKFVYGATTLTFEQPPYIQKRYLKNVTKADETADCDDASTLERQANYLYQEVWYNIQVQAVTIAHLEDFFDWRDGVMDGRDFDYHPDSTSATHYHVKCFNFNFGQAKDGLYSFPLELRVT